MPVCKCAQPVFHEHAMRRLRRIWIERGQGQNSHGHLITGRKVLAARASHSKYVLCFADTQLHRVCNCFRVISRRCRKWTPILISLVAARIHSPVQPAPFRCKYRIRAASRPAPVQLHVETIGMNREWGETRRIYPKLTIFSCPATHISDTFEMLTIC